MISHQALGFGATKTMVFFPANGRFSFQSGQKNNAWKKHQTPAVKSIFSLWKYLQFQHVAICASVFQWLPAVWRQDFDTRKTRDPHHEGCNSWDRHEGHQPEAIAEDLRVRWSTKPASPQRSQKFLGFITIQPSSIGAVYHVSSVEWWVSNEKNTWTNR